MRRRLYREEDAALARLLSDTINDDRYLLLARIRLLKRILGRIRPERSPAPLPRRSATWKFKGPTKKNSAYSGFWEVGIKTKCGVVEHYAFAASLIIHAV